MFDPRTVKLTVTDVGLGTSVATLPRVDLSVVEGRLTLKAPLVAADQVISSVFLDVTCGS